MTSDLAICRVQSVGGCCGHKGILLYTGSWSHRYFWLQNGHRLYQDQSFFISSSLSDFSSCFFFCSMGISERRKDVRRMTEVTFSLPANVLQHSAGTTSLRLAIYIFIIPRLALKICLMILTAVFHRGMLNKAVKAIIALMFFGEPSKASPLTVNVLLDRTDFVQKDISERRVPGFTFSGL